VGEVSSPQNKMTAKLGEIIKSTGPQKQNSCVPVAAVVDHNNKDKTIH
jgi:hypothetical protein